MQKEDDCILSSLINCEGSGPKLWILVLVLTSSVSLNILLDFSKLSDFFKPFFSLVKQVDNTFLFGKAGW